MPAPFGSITFGDVVGVITPQSVPDVEPVENPGGVSATNALPGAGRVDRLTYRGWFTASQKAALYATVDTTLMATDETGDAVLVKVKSVQPSERKAKAYGVLGKWVEVTVEVIAWTAPP